MGLFSSIGSLVGGLFNPVAGLIGGVLGGGLDENRQENQQQAVNVQSQANFEQNVALQKEFAQQGVRWRVEDARAAGISPLTALGAQPVSFSPTHADFAGPSPDNDFDMGQNVWSSINSTRTADERAAAATRALLMERGQLENDLLRSQIALTQAQASPPGPGSNYLVDGQTQSGLVSVVPSKRTSAFPGVDHTEAAISPANKLFRNADGSIVIWPSADAKQSIEDTPYEWEHLWRNRIVPWMTGAPERFRHRVSNMFYERR